MPRLEERVDNTNTGNINHLSILAALFEQTQLITKRRAQLLEHGTAMSTKKKEPFDFYIYFLYFLNQFLITAVDL